MRFHRQCIGGLLVVAFVACEPAVELSTGPSFGSGKSVVQKVTGSGHVPSGSGLREFTFHAQILNDGSAKGSYRIHFTASGQFLEVDVTCATIVGNTAWVAGKITDSNVGVIQIGSVSYFYAIDNGEGNGASPDRVSSARINDVDGEDVRFCTERPLLLPSFDIANGNVQVH